MVSNRLMILFVSLSLLFVVNVCGQSLEGKAGSSGTPDLLKSILDGQPQTALALINQGADVNATDTTTGSAPGSTALMYAAWKGDTAIVNALLQKGAEVNAKNKYGLTALIRAVAKGHTSIVKTLLQKGAVVNVKDNIVGMTPLLSATLHDDTTIMQILLANGANVSAQDNGGNTALMDAVIDGHMVAVQVLLAERCRCYDKKQKWHDRFNGCGKNRTS